MDSKRRDSGAMPQDVLDVVDAYKYKRNFIKLIRATFGSYADRQLIYSAYDYQSGLFSGINRESGGSYMNSHLVPVAIIMMKILGSRDPEVVVSALGHDSIEDKKYVTKELFSKMFTPRSANIVMGVTKPDLGQLKKYSVGYSEMTVEVTRSHGFDSVQLKCDGDRLHNMVTLWGTSTKKRRKVWETERFYLPLGTEFGLECAELRRAIRLQRLNLHIDDSH